jgi:hypothetical protein
VRLLVLLGWETEGGERGERERIEGEEGEEEWDRGEKERDAESGEDEWERVEKKRGEEERGRALKKVKVQAAGCDRVRHSCTI